MPPELVPGVSHTRRIIVERDRTIGFMGEEFRAYATPSMIAAVEKRRVSFSFQVHDAVEVVGRGIHVRFIVDKPKTAERLAAKKIKASSVPGAFPN